MYLLCLRLVAQSCVLLPVLQRVQAESQVQALHGLAVPPQRREHLSCIVLYSVGVIVSVIVSVRVIVSVSKCAQGAGTVTKKGRKFPKCDTTPQNHSSNDRTLPRARRSL